MPERSHLEPSDYVVFGRLALLRLVLPLLKRAMPTTRLVTLMARPRPVPAEERRRQIVISAASRLWRGSSGPCLERSLAIFSELGRGGHSPRLVLAMGRTEGELVGHAWVEVHGAAVLESSDPQRQYAQMVAFDAEGRRIPSD